MAKASEQPHLVITCEHAGNEVPDAYSQVLPSIQNLLSTHQGYDIGALSLAKLIQHQLQSAYFDQHISRLLIDCNRSSGNPSLYYLNEAFLDALSKKKLMNEVYVPYRNEVESFIAEIQNNENSVLHISIHTFTDNFFGVLRDGDIGVLFDPKCKEESIFSLDWINELKLQLPDYIVRPNYPYLGTDDGFTTYLRTKFPKKYIGIELEVNQKWVDSSHWEKLKVTIANSLSHVLSSY